MKPSVFLPSHHLLAGLPLALLAGLALGPLTAQAQTTPASQTPNGVIMQKASPAAPKPLTIRLDGPTHKGPTPILYIDGQRRDSTVLKDLNPNDIARVEVLKGEGAKQVATGLGPDEAQRGVLFITTKANENQPAVIAFNQRVGQLAKQPARSAGQLGINPDKPLTRSLPTEVRYYLNGQPSTKEQVGKLDPQTIAGIDVLKGKAAADYTHDPTATTGVILVRTK